MWGKQKVGLNVHISHYLLELRLELFVIGVLYVPCVIALYTCPEQRLQIEPQTIKTL